MYKFFAAGKRILFDGMGNVSIPTDKGDETELDTESVKKIIKDNISFFEFLVEYRNTVYAHIRNTEERNKAQTVAPDFYKNLTEKNDNVFDVCNMLVGCYDIV
jgi:hypothetical protein